MTKITMDKEIFTTFEVGEICQVYHTTVINWINKGRLKAHTTPGRHRRVNRGELIRFMKQFNIPIPPDLIERDDPRPRILAVDDDPSILHLLKKTFSPHSDKVHLTTMANSIEALVQVGKEIPDLILLDVAMPAMDGIQVCQSLKSNPDTTKIKIIVITGQTLFGNHEQFLMDNVEAIFKKPFSPIKLLEKVSLVLKLEGLAYATDHR